MGGKSKKNGHCTCATPLGSFSVFLNFSEAGGSESFCTEVSVVCFTASHKGIKLGEGHNKAKPTGYR
jgi:hypothetical protein